MQDEAHKEPQVEGVKFKKLKFRLLFTPAGDPTCCVVEGVQTCKFLDARRLGTKPVCGWVDSGDNELFRRDGNGYLIPHKKCPLHS